MKHLKYWDVLHLSTEKAWVLAFKAFLVIRAGRKGLGSSLFRGCMELWKILWSIHNELTDRRCHKSTLRSGIKNLQALVQASLHNYLCMLASRPDYLLTHWNQRCLACLAAADRNLSSHQFLIIFTYRTECQPIPIKQFRFTPPSSCSVFSYRPWCFSHQVFHHSHRTSSFCYDFSAYYTDFLVMFKGKVVLYLYRPAYTEYSR